VHAKYIPALVWYRGYPQIKIGNVKNSEVVEKGCPVNVYETKGKSLSVKNASACILCDACVDIADPQGSIEVKPSSKDFIFFIESFGKLKPKEILDNGLTVLESKLEEFEKIKKEEKKLPEQRAKLQGEFEELEDAIRNLGLFKKIEKETIEENLVQQDISAIRMSLNALSKS